VFSYGSDYITLPDVLLTKIFHIIKDHFETLTVAPLHFLYGPSKYKFIIHLTYMYIEIRGLLDDKKNFIVRLIPNVKINVCVTHVYHFVTPGAKCSRHLFLFIVSIFVRSQGHTRTTILD